MSLNGGFSFQTKYDRVSKMPGADMYRKSISELS